MQPPIYLMLFWEEKNINFTRHSYPEQFKVAYAFIFVLAHVGNQTHNPGVASTMLYQQSHTGCEMNNRNKVIFPASSVVVNLLFSYSQSHK